MAAFPPSRWPRFGGASLLRSLFPEMTGTALSDAPLEHRRDKKAEGKMRIVAATKSEAERIIADVWQVLERMKLPSPMITVVPEYPRLTIELRFKQPQHEKLVRDAALSGYGRATLA